MVTKKIFKNPWLIGITTSIIGGLLISIFPNEFIIACKIINKSIYKILTYAIPVWIFAIIFIAIVFIIILVKKYMIVEQEDPAFTKYIEEKMDTKLKWSWSWESNPLEGYKIKNLFPHCPNGNCDQRLMTTADYEFIYKCPRCGSTYKITDYETEKDALYIIGDNLTRKYPEYQKK